MSEAKKVLGVLTEKDLVEFNRVRLKREAIARTADAMTRAVMHSVQEEQEIVEREHDTLMGKIIKEHGIAHDKCICVDHLSGQIIEHEHASVSLSDILGSPAVAFGRLVRRSDDDGGNGPGPKTH